MTIKRVRVIRDQTLEILFHDSAYESGVDPYYVALPAGMVTQVDRSDGHWCPGYCLRIRCLFHFDGKTWDHINVKREYLKEVKDEQDQDGKS